MKPNGMIENPRTDARLVLRDYRDGRDGVVAIAPEMLYPPASDSSVRGGFE